jgi:sulfite reductase beta subunit-like hemoprotein
MADVIGQEVETEIRRFAEEIAKLEAGETDPDDFKRFRLENGVYGIRGTTDRHMVRIKVRFGRITPEQLETVADIAERFTPTGLAHVTTRQDIQLHNVKRTDVVETLRRLAECGLTTREACGNTVRNVTACPYSGVSMSETFDVTPYADALSAYFLRNPINQNLPRKFKIAFEGCAEDHARTPIHDIGIVAKVREYRGGIQRGFQLYIAGGLGAQPRSADLLEDFTPADLLIPTAEAIIRVFDRNGERRPERINRMRARMKFLARSWGIDKLREAIFQERKAILATRSGRSPARIEAAEEQPPTVAVLNPPAPHISVVEYRRWRATNVVAQKQPGWYVITVRCPLGDIDPKGLRKLARIARRYCGGRLRLAIAQNILLRWVPEAALPWIFSELQGAGLAHSDADRIADITRCPGADTCQIALTHSRGLASALGDVFKKEFSGIAEIQDISIKISGCMNSCGQHHIADIGLHGATETSDEHELPVYVMMVGGRTREGRAEFGKIAGKIPSRSVPGAVRSVLQFYVSERSERENFRTFLDRVGTPAIKKVIGPFTQMPSYEFQRDLFYDLGAEEQFKAAVGVGECAV